MTPNFSAVARYVFNLLEKDLDEKLYYHGVHHTRDDVLPAAERLATLAGVSGEDLLVLQTAALFHDTGYLRQYHNNEPMGVEIAREILPSFGYDTTIIDRVEPLILATNLSVGPKTFLEELLCDADLDSLGREDFFVVGHTYRRELLARGESFTLREWYERQEKFLSGHQYHTDVARQLRDRQKERNLEEVRGLLHR